MATSNLEMFAGVAKKPQHLGAPNRGEHSEAAGAFAEAVIRSVELIVQPDPVGLFFTRGGDDHAQSHFGYRNRDCIRSFISIGASGREDKDNGQSKPSTLLGCGVSQAATADRGSASGIYLACYFAGGLVGTAILGQIFDRVGWPACVGGIGISLGVAALLAVRLKMTPV